ncbi:MAG: NnrS family protein [Gammaproteobacteria bacterium]|nr:NnrS family protein [Gammaproteobacteria bacterium]
MTLHASASARRMQPFRPLFFAAAAFASLGMLAWGTFLHLGWLPESALPPLLWHGHEMLFGFAGALIGGFLLTAVANWTGRTPVGPRTLTLLVTAWLGARIALLTPAPMWFAAACELGYLLGLVVAMAQVVMATQNRRNYFVIALLAVYAGLDISFFVGAAGDAALASRALIWTVDWLTLLMLAIGGRVIPFFTVRRLPGIGAMDRRTPALAVNLGAALALVLDVAGASASLRGLWWLLLAAAALARMLHWRGWRSGGESMLWPLHLGYLWLAAGMALRGAALVGALARPETETLHAITVGALGTLSVAMMTRVTQGHSGATIAANRWLALAFLLPSAAALLRLSGQPALWPAAAVAWTLAYLIYLLATGALLLRGASSPAAPG